MENRDPKLQMMDEFSDLLSAFLQSCNEFYLSKTENGFETDIYADYRDEMSESTIAEILESEHPMEAFDERMFDCYGDYAWQMIDEIHQVCKREETLIAKYNEILDKFGDSLSQDFDDFLRDNLNELVSVNYPYDHYLDQKVCTDIMIDSGDANYDFACNNILNYYGNGEIDEHSSIAWLCEQQGKKELFENAIKDATKENVISEGSDKIKVEGHIGTWYVIDSAIYNGKELFLLEHETYGDETACLIVDSYNNLILEDVWNGFSDYEDFLDGNDEMQVEQDKFVKSVVQELENLPSHMSALTFCVSMSLKELIGVNEKLKNNEPFTLTVDKSAECGLYDSWSGGGSVLEIELVKDVEIPSDMLYKVCADKSLPWHGIHEVYGVSDSLWRASVTIKDVEVNDITLSNEIEQEFFTFAELYMSFNDDNRLHCEQCFQNNVGFDASAQEAHAFVLSFLEEILERHSPFEVLEEVPNAKDLLTEVEQKKSASVSQKGVQKKEKDSSKENKENEDKKKDEKKGTSQDR